MFSTMFVTGCAPGDAGTVVLKHHDGLVNLVGDAAYAFKAAFTDQKLAFAGLHVSTTYDVGTAAYGYVFSTEIFLNVVIITIVSLPLQHLPSKHFFR